MPKTTAQTTALVFVLLLVATSATASTYYIAPLGADAALGSMERPWSSLRFALTRLASGDTLYLRGGTYLENGLTITGKSGILISAFPGEAAEISGAQPLFTASPDTGWELYDPAVQLYRSRRIFVAVPYLGTWLLDDSIQIVQYGKMANLQSANYGPVHGFDPVYQGPGILWGTDARLYIRLQSNPNDLVGPAGAPLAPVPADVDPNHHRIAVSFAQSIISNITSSSFLTFRGLTFSHAKVLMYLGNQVSNLVFDGCTFNFGSYAVVLPASDGPRDVEIHHCDFNNALPGYVYWCDVKNKDNEVGEAYPEFQSEAISGPAPGFYIHHNRFHDSFDAMDLKGGTENTRIVYNEFYRLRDDAITLKIVKNVEVAYNLMWQVGEGVSCDFDLTDQRTNGDVYVHHNVIDASHYQHGGRPGNYRASNWPVWMIIDAFGSHGDSFAGKWKVYNNTTVHRRSGYAWDPAELPAKVLSSPDLYVLNNIFLILDDRIAFRGRVSSSGAHYDGNVMCRLLDTTYHKPEIDTYPLFCQFGNGSNFATLADFKAGSGAAWESHGLELDPGLDLDGIVNESYDGWNTWKRYAPANSAVLSPGASYEELAWPGTEGIDYRGASFQSPVSGVAGHRPAGDGTPRSFGLEQNYPNPFNPVTTIRFTVAANGVYSLKVFNLLGQEVERVLEDRLTPGTYTVRFNGDGLASGAYLYVLRGASAPLAKTMILIK